MQRSEAPCLKSFLESVLGFKWKRTFIRRLVIRPVKPLFFKCRQGNITEMRTTKFLDPSGRVEEEYGWLFSAFRHPLTGEIKTAKTGPKQQEPHPKGELP
jgi:hypothetical protein